MSTEDEPGWYAVMRDTGEVFVPGETDVWADLPDDPNALSPMLLDSTDWVQCHTFQNSGWTIISHPFYWDGLPRDMRLECGTETSSGWHHIRARHMVEWKNRITQTGVPNANTDPWDDLMWWGATNALDYPYSSSGPTDGKLCVTTQIDMHRTDNGQFVYTFKPTYSWSLTNNRLVTGIPTTHADC